MAHRIYLVEDHPIMRDALTVLLGFEADLDLCGTAASAEEALDVCPWADCDLLLTDVSLPGIDGFALTQQVHAGHPGLPIVVVSADDSSSSVRRAKAAGAMAYLSKAGLCGTLAPTLRGVLNGEVPTVDAGA